MHRRRRIVARRERIKLSPGTGTASSGVPVWKKSFWTKLQQTTQPFFIIKFINWINPLLFQYSILKLSYSYKTCLYLNFFLTKNKKYIKILIKKIIYTLCLVRYKIGGYRSFRGLDKGVCGIWNYNKKYKFNCFLEQIRFLIKQFYDFEYF